jgi:hypothetical protein
MTRATNQFDDLSDLEHRDGQANCICGRHRSQREHDYEAHRMLQCEPLASQPRRFDALLAREAMQVNFPED